MDTLSENTKMKHLCFDYTLSFAAGFNALYIAMWLLFLCCLSFIEFVDANQCWDVINFIPADKMSLWQEGARSLATSFELKLHAASNFTLQFTVIPITNGSVRELLDLFSKSRKKVFSKFSEN